MTDQKEKIEQLDQQELDYIFDVLGTEDESAEFYEDSQDLDCTSVEEEDEEPDGVHADTAHDAFIYSMNNKNKVDFEYMKRISGLSKDKLMTELLGREIVPDPVRFKATGDFDKCLVPCEELIGGNPYKKIEIARSLQEKTGLFGVSIDLLEKNFPDTVDGCDIYMNLGATWIPPQVIQDFVQNLLKTYTLPNVEHNDLRGKWTLTCSTLPNRVLNESTYGTHRCPAMEIIECTLNNKPVKVRDARLKEDGEHVEYILNVVETERAQEKQRAIKEQWYKYVHGNRILETKLQEIYMEHYGFNMTRYSGKDVIVPGLNPAITLYEHQKAAISRIRRNHNIMLAHKVGSGKTMEYICGAEELLRLKQAKKVMIVVPLNNVGEVKDAYKELYPDRELFVIMPKKNFSVAERANTLEKIKAMETGVILMPFSSFNMINVTLDCKVNNIRREIDACREAIGKVRGYYAKDSLINRISRLNDQISKLREEYEYAPEDCFELLGVDVLVVDEAHHYKNITLNSSSDNIVGMHSTGAKKADSMLEKVECVQRIGGRVIFSTATPVTNSMADLYSCMRYMMPDVLQALNIYHFDDWINTFCTETHDFALDISGQLKLRTFCSKFKNLPELMAVLSETFDFYNGEDGVLNLPDFAGHTELLIPRNELQREYFRELALRAEKVRLKRVSPKDDNPLKITTDGRKCAVDVRLANPEIVYLAGDSKISICAAKMVELYHAYPGTTQIAFCDISTPKAGFNVYDELKNRLVAAGIPAEEIAFIHDATNEAQRAKLEKQFNAGIIRILVGSTMKLGVGTNVQQKLLAVYHLDVPYRPSDLTQREGRILRNGNQNKQVFIFRPVTEDSFDAFSWQILQNKQLFISQFMSGAQNAIRREEDDYSDTVLDIATIKALAIGNPLIRSRVETANRLERARINMRQKKKELTELEAHANTLPRQITARQELIRKVEADMAYYARFKKPISQEERESFGEELLYALQRNAMLPTERVFERYQGFDVVLPRNMDPRKPYVILRRPGSNLYVVKLDDAPASGCSRRIDHVLIHLSERKEEHERVYADLLVQQEQAQKELDKGNEYDALVEQLSADLELIDKTLLEGDVA